MHVLVTRPAEDAEPLKSRIEALGCKVSLAPLMEIVPNEIAPDDMDGATALIATSGNALSVIARSLVELPLVQKLPLYVVGPGTAAAARVAGFQNIVEGAGRARDLVPLLTSKGAKIGKRPIYLRGDHLAFDLEAALAQAGVTIVPVTAYRAVAAEALPATVIKALQTGGIDIVTLMSPRTARIWARLVAVLSPPQLSGVTYLCLSNRVAEALGPLAKADKVVVPSHPNVDDMIALVKRLAAGSKAE